MRRTVKDFSLERNEDQYIDMAENGWEDLK